MSPLVDRIVRIARREKGTSEAPRDCSSSKAAGSDLMLPAEGRPASQGRSGLRQRELARASAESAQPRTHSREYTVSLLNLGAHQEDIRMHPVQTKTGRKAPRAAAR